MSNTEASEDNVKSPQDISFLGELQMNLDIKSLFPDYPHE